MGCTSSPRQDRIITTPQSRINFLLTWSVAVAGLAVLLPTVVGCGGGERRSRPVAQTDGNETNDGVDAGLDQNTESTATTGDGTSGGRGVGRPGAMSEEPTTDNVASNDGSEAQPKPAEVPERPDDVTKWKPVDFASAKIDQDPKLVEAVAHIDAKYQGDDNAADTLYKLLILDDPPDAVSEGDETSGMEERGRERGGNREMRGSGMRGMNRDGMRGSSRGMRGGYGGYNDPTLAKKVKIGTDLAAEVVAVLGRNNSATARKYLHNLATGTIQTPLDPMSLFRSVLYAIVDNPHSEHEDKLFVLVTEPEKIIQESDDPDTSSAFSVDSARKEILQVLSDEASVTLRTRLARYLEDPDVPMETAKELEQLLSGGDDRNLPAQILLYQNIHTSESTYSRLGPWIVRGSQEALGHLMGIDDLGGSGYGRSGRGGFESGRGRGMMSSGRGEMGAVGRGRGVDMLGGGRRSGRSSREEGRPSRDGEPTKPFDPRLVHGSFAKLLWIDRFAEKIGEELLDNEQLNTQKEKLQILATIPTATARAKIAELADNLQDNPNPFSQAGMFGQELTDPAFLLVAKGIYHSQKVRRGTRGRTGSGHGMRGSDMTGGRDGRGGSGYGENDLNTGPWLREIGQYVVALSERLADAESTWTEDTQPTSGSDGSEEPSGPLAAMGVPLHSGAEIAAEYHLRWPADAATLIPGIQVAPLEVHYVCIEQEARPSKILTAYKRHSGGGKVHNIQDGVWLDGLVADRATDAKRSIDIRIYNKRSSDSALRSTEPRDMVIEILVIAIPSVKPEPASEPSPPADDAAKDSEKT